jgi:hypothetical protein
LRKPFPLAKVPLQDRMMAQKSAKLITRLITDHVEVLCRERTVKKAGV